MDEGRAVPLTLKPGIVKEKTDYNAEGTWVDGSLVRFNFGQPESWRGWAFASDAVNRARYVGHGRDMLPWQDLAQRNLVAIANEKKLYVWESGVYYDITPVRASASATGLFSTTSGSRQVFVSFTAHNAVVGDWVAFSSVSTTIGGSILLSPTVSTRTGYEITSVVDVNGFFFLADTTATATSAATGQGDIDFFLPTGNKDFSFLYGWGVGNWSEGPWGISGGASTYATFPTLWSLDNWGEYLLANQRGGPIYVWQNNLEQSATLVSSAPSQNNYILVSPEDRHLITFGTMDLTSVFDPLLIRWCDAEDYSDWIPSALNTAGQKRLSGGGSAIQGARRSRGQIMIWTDHDLSGMRFIGGDFIFSFDQLGEDCGLFAPHAHVETGGVVYWMSNERFYAYDGTVQLLPCDVLDYIFSNVDYNNKTKIYAGSTPAANEVIWFYPSTSSRDFECDKYVTYNHVEKCWAIGNLERTLWTEDHSFNVPIAVGTSGEGLFYQETGTNAAGSAMPVFIESAFFDPGEGDSITFLSKIIPDFSDFSGNQRHEGVVEITLCGRKYHADVPAVRGPYAITSLTRKFNPRLRAREISIKFQSNDLQSEWRHGKTRVFLQEDGQA